MGSTDILTSLVLNGWTATRNVVTELPAGPGERTWEAFPQWQVSCSKPLIASDDPCLL